MAYLSDKPMEMAAMKRMGKTSMPQETEGDHMGQMMQMMEQMNEKMDMMMEKMGMGMGMEEEESAV